MASTKQCEYCGSTITSADSVCPHCGARNSGYVADTERHIFLPKSIEELKEYCAERGMPLLRMRFFIGEDYRQPKAFGIYRSGRNVIVYKNKANGQRVIRYKGPDEEHAVNELFQKLLEECHNRGIYPDGKPQEGASEYAGIQQKKKRIVLHLIVTILMLLVIPLSMIYGKHQHRDDGYYRTNSQTVYYRYGNDWYYTDPLNNYGYWYETDDFPATDYEQYALGESWDSGWGVSNFKDSSTWDDIQDSNSSSSADYDSWDSGSTDWDSDW